MKSPFTGKDMIVVTEIREMTFRKEQFNLIFHAYKCVDTGDQFEDEKFAELNYNQVINQYRVKHRIPFPEQIRSIRERYALSAAKMSEVLGMGPNTWSNYESGEVPSKSHGNLIQMISETASFKKYVESYCELEEKDRFKILKKLENLPTQGCYCNDKLSRFEKLPDITTGFKPFDKEKTKQIVLFFAENQQPYKTKINKLLWYADNYQFKNTAQSISGMSYRAISYGPVPEHYEVLFDVLEDMEIIEKDWTLTDNGPIEKIIAAQNQKFDSSIFTPSELETLGYIAEKFKNTSASEIVDISHHELAWKENIDAKRIISFQYAFQLETI
jgi:putative zinc finger/helix-turn-helix YgiT family protein